MKGKEEGGTGISEGWQGSFEGIPEKLPCQPEEIPVPPDSFPFICIVSYKGGMANPVQSLVKRETNPVLLPREQYWKKAKPVQSLVKRAVLASTAP